MMLLQARVAFRPTSSLLNKCRNRLSTASGVLKNQPALQCRHMSNPNQLTRVLSNIGPCLNSSKTISQPFTSFPIGQVNKYMSSSCTQNESSRSTNDQSAPAGTDSSNQSAEIEDSSEGPVESVEDLEAQSTKGQDTEQIANFAVSGKETDDAILAPLHEKIKDLQDRLLRALAEQENARRRNLQEMESVRKFSITGFATSMLEVADSLQLALEAMSTFESGDDALKNIYDGVRLTDGILQSAFDKHGIVRFDPIGEKFDPLCHEALFEIQDSTKQKGSVAQVVKMGYKIQNRVLRPAKVGVAKG